MISSDSTKFATFELSSMPLAINLAPAIANLLLEISKIDIGFPS
jgi:hypothetical protein